MPAPFPADPDPAELADWLEVVALEAADGDASLGDCERKLSLLGVSGAEAKALAALEESRRRESDCGPDRYPFVVEADVVRRRTIANPIESHPEYFFCLALCRRRRERGVVRGDDRLLFERLSLAAAVGYLGGEGMVFGTSATREDRGASAPQGGFRRRVERLCREFGEGEFREQKTGRTQDYGIDVVAWRDFPDRRPGKLALMGQCATGENWREKLGDAKPDAFWEQWMGVGRISRFTRCFFMPGRILDAGGPEVWDSSARRAGILFDRCRIARFAPSASHSDSNLRSELVEAASRLLAAGYVQTRRRFSREPNP